MRFHINYEILKKNLEKNRKIEKILINALLNLYIYYVPNCIFNQRSLD
jgi:hypothetical protein